jgi:hypothetical protein
MRSLPISCLLTAAAFALACEGGTEAASPTTDTRAFAGVPANGNGNKLVIPTDEDLPAVDCGGGEFLDAHAEGWIQLRLFPQPKNPNIALDIFHTVFTFTNSAGETFKFNDLGPDRIFVDGGNVFLAIIGRTSGGHIGQFVIDLATGEVVFVAGRDFADAFTLACEALT